MTNQVIPAEAVEAAAIAMGRLVWADYDHETDMDRDEHESNARAALEAAAPHMQNITKGDGND